MSSYSSRDMQNVSRSFIMLASTAPPWNTMCLRRGGCSMQILNFYVRLLDVIESSAVFYTPILVGTTFDL